MKLIEKNGISYFVSEKLEESRIIHGFTTRKNKGFALPVFPWKPSAIDESTLFEFAKRLGIEHKRFVFQEQVHSDKIKVIRQDDISNKRMTIIPECDGLVTNLKDVCLVSFSADCLSVLLAHPESGAIANAHSGRRGAIRGIAQKLVLTLTMEYGVFPGELKAMLGTSISGLCYEVKDDVIDELKQHDADSLCFLIKRESKLFFDLRGYVIHSLTMVGVNPENIDSQPVCSHCSEELFYSYRRDGSVLGSQAAFISS